jgi:hypothetical protein
MIAEALSDYANATARVFDDRMQAVGASEVGQCSRRTFWIKNEDDPAHSAPRDSDYVDTWGARTRGSYFEQYFWEPALRARYGDNLLYAGADQQTLTSEFLSATPDGLLINLPRDVLAALGIADIGADRSLLVECKTADPRTALAEAKPEHTFQAQCQLGLIRELTKHRPEYALISYSDASFWNEGKEFAVGFDKTIFTNAKARARRIMTATAAEELPPEGWIAGGHECRYCPFTRACGRQRHAVPRQTVDDKPDPQFVAEIADLAHAIKQQETESDAATAKLRQLQHEIRERLRARGVRRVEGDGVSVVWSAVKGRPSFDMKGIREAAAAAGIDLSRFETVGDQTDRLVIRLTAATP